MRAPVAAGCAGPLGWLREAIGATLGIGLMPVLANVLALIHAIDRQRQRTAG